MDGHAVPIKDVRIFTDCFNMPFSVTQQDTVQYDGHCQNILHHPQEEGR